MKTDDDVFINIPNLFHILLGGSLPAYEETSDLFEDDKTLDITRAISHKHFILGKKHFQPKTIRDSDSKW